MNLKMNLTKEANDKVLEIRESFANYMISKRNDDNFYVGGYFPTPYGVLHLYWKRQMWAYEYVNLESDDWYFEFSLL